jgi:hypothetical protein
MNFGDNGNSRGTRVLVLSRDLRRIEIIPDEAAEGEAL